MSQIEKRLDKLEKRINEDPANQKITSIEVIGDRGNGPELLSFCEYDWLARISKTEEFLPDGTLRITTGQVP